jgi:predicted DNA-binding protein (MmcQ/YjbR family)
MDSEDLRNSCLSFPDASETFPFGPLTSVFKVAGKMFALSQLGADSLRVSLKCEPALAEALRETHVAVIPGYHLNKRHWNTVILDGTLSDQTIEEMIEDSYDLVVGGLPLARQNALGWVPGDEKRSDRPSGLGAARGRARGCCLPVAVRDSSSRSDR